MFQCIKKKKATWYRSRTAGLVVLVGDGVAVDLKEGAVLEARWREEGCRTSKEPVVVAAASCSGRGEGAGEGSGGDALGAASRAFAWASRRRRGGVAVAAAAPAAGGACIAAEKEKTQGSSCS